ncbi:MAG: TadE/TadG family type IV pilus assembly protein [Pseudomonadota bacterium]
MRFLRETKGAAAVEFVIMTPILLAILIFAAEYSNALMAREALESAMRDATRMIARAPLGDTDNDPDVVTSPVVQTYFKQQAAQLIANRTGLPVDAVQFEVTAEVIETGGGLRTEYIRINAEGKIAFALPMLSFLYHYIANADARAGESWQTTAEEMKLPASGFFILSSFDTARYSYESIPGLFACNQASRQAGLCGGPP